MDIHPSIHTYIGICIGVYIYRNICPYIGVYIYIIYIHTVYVCVHVCMCVWLYVCMCVGAFVCLSVCLSVRASVCLYVHTYVHAYVCMYVCMLITQVRVSLHWHETVTTLPTGFRSAGLRGLVVRYTRRIRLPTATPRVWGLTTF